MKLRAIDLFAGAGGTTEGAENAGVNVVWAANHNPLAVEYHAKNHPSAIHACQDLQQANWSLLPKHDLLLGSPCCQGHSYASGQAAFTGKADESRSTAWAIVSCLEVNKEEVGIIENVPSFLTWGLYKAWEFAIRELGYSLSLNFVNAADVGVPQNRPRLFIVVTRSKKPIELNLDKEIHIPARSFIDTSFDGHNWDLVSNRVAATQRRVVNGRKRYGELFLDAAYGSEVGGRSLDKPIGTIMTVNKHSLVMGDHIRPITISEQAAAQTFSSDRHWPESKTETKKMIGNAVPPKMAEKVIRAVVAAA